MAEVERLRAQVDRESERLAEKASELRLRGMKCFDTVGLSTHVKCDSEYCEACHVDVSAKLHMKFLHMTSSIPLEMRWRSVLRHVRRQVEIAHGERRADFWHDIEALDSFGEVEVEAPVNKRRRIEVEVTMAAAQQPAQQLNIGRCRR